MQHHRSIALAVAATIAGAILSGPAHAQESIEVKIARAMSAAPPAVSAQATILDVDGTVLRAGQNGWTCLPGISLIPGDTHPMCNDATWMRWMDAAAAGEPFSTDVIGYSYMLQGDALVHNHDPAATEPDDSGHWVQEGPHLMLLLPQEALLDTMSDDPHSGGPYVMWGGTPLAHVMVPVGPRAARD